MIIEVKRRGHVQRMTYEEFESRIQDGEVEPQTPVRFETVTGDSFRPAGELELYQALADPGALKFRRNLTNTGVPIVTAILVGVQIRIFLWALTPGTKRWLQENFTNWAPAILEHAEFYRLFTYGILHVNFTHLLFNLLFLAYTGWNLERAIGRANLVLLYFGSVFAGGLLSMSMAPDRPSLGASGGDFGLLAAVVIFGWKHWEAIPERSRKYFGYALVPYLAFSMSCGLNAENVDNWGHLGGLLGGAVLMTFLEPEALSRKARYNRVVRWITVGAMAVCCAVLVGAGPRLVPLEQHRDSGWTVERPTYWREGWTFTGDRGWFAPTGKATLVVATTVQVRPVSVEEAADNLVQRIGSGGKNPELLSTEDLTIHGWPARRLEVTFDLAGEPQRVDALVLTRGVFEHRIQFQAVRGAAQRYDPLADRVIDSVVMYETEELDRARKRVETHPRSWEPAVELGEELYRGGFPGQALRAFERALSLAPGQPRAMVGQLRVYADYGLQGGVEAARKALGIAADEPRVIVAAADVLAADGFEDEGRAALEEAWLNMPGDQVLRRARLQWGLSVELTPRGSEADVRGQQDENDGPNRGPGQDSQ